MDPIAFLTQFWSGLYSACFLFLTAAGLTLVFGVGDFFNFAHGAFFMLGGYVGFSLSHYLGVPFFACPVIATAAISLVAWAIFRLLIFRFGVNRANFTVQLLSTYGLLLIMSNGARLLWGNNFISQKIPQALARPLPLFSFSLSGYQFVIVFVTLGVALTSILAIHFGRFGRIVRAAINDPKMVEHLGVRTNRVIEIIFMVGAAMAALGGSLAVPILAITPTAGDDLIISALIVTVIAGRGNLLGAAMAAILIAEMTSFGNLILPRVSPALAYLVALAVLALKPRGLCRPLISDEHADRV